jgi:hypothetical protein
VKPVDPPRKRDFVPGNRRTRRHRIVGFFAVIFLLYWLRWVPFNGWLGSLVVTTFFSATLEVTGLVRGLIARKTDPLKGAAFGDHVGPITRPSSELGDAVPRFPARRAPRNLDSES